MQTDTGRQQVPRLRMASRGKSYVDSAISDVCLQEMYMRNRKNVYTCHLIVSLVFKKNREKTILRLIKNAAV